MANLCGHCGTSLWKAGIRRIDAKFCSANCRAAAHRASGYQRPPSPPKPPREAICIICGTIFYQSGIGRTRFTCASDCAKAKRQADSRAFHERRKADGRMVVFNDRRRKHEPRPCRDCGRTLRIGQRCRDCSHALRKAVGGPSGQAEARLRAFERDNWTCRLCGGHIDADLTYPDPMSPSIDHVVPLSVAYERHGLDFEDTEDNWQAAHYVCNTSKGARVAS